MGRKKKKKARKKKVKAKPKKKKAKAKPKPSQDPEPVQENGSSPAYRRRFFEREPELDPIEDVIRRNVDLVPKRKLQAISDRPLPDVMSSDDIESELEELLGND